MSRKRTRYNLLDNIQRFFRALRADPKKLSWQCGPWAVDAYGPGDVVADEEAVMGLMREPTDEEVMKAIKLVPAHFSAHQIPAEESYAAWQQSDPFVGQTLTTFGASPIYESWIGGQTLQSTAGSGTESRTLQDPNNGAITFAMTLTKRSTVNLQVMGNTPWWLQTTLNNFTQNGNFGIFSAVDQTVQIFSVPTSKSGSSSTYTSIHNSPVTNTTKFRWCAVFSDGATVN